MDSKAVMRIAQASADLAADSISDLNGFLNLSG
jgi:hypothetical protein